MYIWNICKNIYTYIYIYTLVFQIPFRVCFRVEKSTPWSKYMAIPPQKGRWLIEGLYKPIIRVTVQSVHKNWVVPHPRNVDHFFGPHHHQIMFCSDTFCRLVRFYLKPPPLQCHQNSTMFDSHHVWQGRPQKVRRKGRIHDILPSYSKEWPPIFTGMSCWYSVAIGGKSGQITGRVTSL